MANKDSRMLYRIVKKPKETDGIVVDRGKWDTDHKGIVEKLINEEGFDSREVWFGGGKVIFLVMKNAVKANIDLLFYTSRTATGMKKLAEATGKYGLSKKRQIALSGGENFVFYQLNPNDSKYEYAGKVKKRK